MQNEVTRRDLRSFGLLVGGIFALIGVWPAVVHGADHRLWAVGLAALLIAPALIYPTSLKLVHKIWMKLGHALGWVNTRILLSVVFFGVVTPMGLIRRMLRKDSMAKRPQGDMQSYRVDRKPRPASHLTRQY